MVAEGGWVSERDHRAIAGVLIKISRRVKSTSLNTITLAYCRGLYRASDPWLLELDGDQQPPSWPKKLRWNDYLGKWKKVLARAGMAISGKLGDPCRGRADHWNSTSDKTPTRLYRVNCGPTLNRFWVTKKKKY
jgi:hypothetical protein